jgi:hypothetical protein
MLRDIPPGTHCFVDANIFYWYCQLNLMKKQFDSIRRDESTLSKSVGQR